MEQARRLGRELKQELHLGWRQFQKVMYIIFGRRFYYKFWNVFANMELQLLQTCT